MSTWAHSSAEPEAEAHRFCDRLRAMAPEDRSLALARLAGMLAESQRVGDLQHLLSTYPYLDARLRTAGPQALIADFDRYTAVAGSADDDLLSLRSALALSAESLADEPSQLPSQLLGRLGGDADNREALLRQIHAGSYEPWLRPLTDGLAGAGGPLRRTKPGGEGPALLTKDGRTAVAAVRERLLVWDVHSDLLIHELPLPPTQRLCFAQDEAVVVSVTGPMYSATTEAVVQTWRLRDGKELRRFTAPYGTEYASADLGLLVAVDGAAIVVYDFETLEQRAAFRSPSAHDASAFSSERIGTIALSPDGSILAASMWRGRINLFDAGNGKHLRTLADTDEHNMALAFTADGRELLAPAPGMKTVNCWPVSEERPPRMLNATGVQAPITALAAGPDGECIVAGTNSGELHRVGSRSSRRCPHPRP